jgi:hypothetical protein
MVREPVEPQQEAHAENEREVIDALAALQIVNDRVIPYFDIKQFHRPNRTSTPLDVKWLKVDNSQCLKPPKQGQMPDLQCALPTKVILLWILKRKPKCWSMSIFVS